MTAQHAVDWMRGKWIVQMKLHWFRSIHVMSIQDLAFYVNNIHQNCKKEWETCCGAEHGLLLNTGCPLFCSFDNWTKKCHLACIEHEQAGGGGVTSNADVEYPQLPLYTPTPPSAHSQTCHMITHRCVMCILATSSRFVSWPVWLTPTKVPRGWQVATPNLHFG